MKIDAYYDILCPFCFVAKRLLDKAIADHPQVPVEVALKPHMLYPQLPLESHDFRAFFVAKYGEELRVPMWDRVTELGRHGGIAFNFHAIEKGPHAIHGHRAVHFAKRYGKGSAMLNAIYSAYYEDALDVGVHSLLVEIGSALGLPADELAAYLASDADVDAIFAASAAQTEAGITSMPCHVVDGVRIQGEAEPGTWDRIFAARAAEAA